MLLFLKKIWKIVVKIYKIVDEFVLRLDRHHVFLIAAGVAFNILLYLIPMLLMALYIINEVFSVQMIESFLTNVVTDLLPPNDITQNMLGSTIQEINLIFGNSSVAGLIGLLSLLWLSSTLFSSLRSGLNSIFEIETPKIFFIYRIKDIFMTILIAVLILFSSYAIPITTLMMSSLREVIWQPLEPLFTSMSVMIMSLSTSFLLFFGLFRFIPNKRQPWFVVLHSTLLSVVLIEFSRNIFAWYVVKFGTYGKFYGTYAVMVSMAVWIYYMILIMLLSGEISSFIYDKIILPKKQLKKQEIPSIEEKAPM